MRDRLTAGLLTAAFALCAGGAGAQPPVSPAAALAAAPPSAIDYAFPKNGSDVNGLDRSNQAVWQNVGGQRAIMDEIVNGIVRGNADQIEAHWPVFAATFAHEHPDGSFDYAGNESFDGQPGADAFWLGYSAQTLLLLQSSSLGPRYQSRIDAMRPQFAATAQWLAQPEQMAYLLHFDGGVTPSNPSVSGANRLINDAKALILAAKLTGAPGAYQAGEQLLDRALASQSSEGWFPEHGGPDTSYNAVSAMQLAWIALFANDPRLAPAIARSMDWEMSRIDADGRVDDTGNTRTGRGHLLANGKPYNINYSDVTKALVLSSIVTGDPRMMNEAVLVSDYARKTY